MQTQTFVKSFLKAAILGLCFLMFNTNASLVQGAGNAEQQIITLSKDKWQWMSDKNVDKLAQLFDDKAKVTIGKCWP